MYNVEEIIAQIETRPFGEQHLGREKLFEVSNVDQPSSFIAYMFLSSYTTTTTLKTTAVDTFPINSVLCSMSFLPVGGLLKTSELCGLLHILFGSRIRRSEMSGERRTI